MYCQSTSYGRGCNYGPHGIHFHPDDTKLCSYCGSTNYGNGCLTNPFGKVHIHGIMYNNMLKESLVNGFYMHEMFKDLKEYRAYKLGIIDESGNKIKEPITEEERAAFSPITKNFIKIKRYLGSKLDLINRATILEKETKLNYNKEDHKKLLKHTDEFENVFEQLHRAVDAALEDGLTHEQIESLLQK